LYLCSIWNPVSLPSPFLARLVSLSFPHCCLICFQPDPVFFLSRFFFCEAPERYALYSPRNQPASPPLAFAPKFGRVSHISQPLFYRGWIDNPDPIEDWCCFYFSRFLPGTYLFEFRRQLPLQPLRTSPTRPFSPLLCLLTLNIHLLQLGQASLRFFPSFPLCPGDHTSKSPPGIRSRCSS